MDAWLSVNKNRTFLFCELNILVYYSLTFDFWRYVIYLCTYICYKYIKIIFYNDCIWYVCIYYLIF